MKKAVSAIAAVLMLIVLSACTNSSSPATETKEAPAPGSSAVIITFDYQAQSGHASNQFAVWVESTDGNLVKTLYATRFTANGGYKNRPDSISLWVDKSGLSSMAKSQVDVITGATPKTGALTYTWDLTNTNGNQIPPGEYTVFVEGSLRWKNYVLFSAKILVGDNPATVPAYAEYFYEAAQGQAALTNDSSENAMIENVTVQFIPAA